MRTVAVAVAVAAAAAEYERDSSKVAENDSLRTYLLQEDGRGVLSKPNPR